MDTGALFSGCRSYRYKLWRYWGNDRTPNGRDHVCFLMLNPSTADETKNDPTVERCQRRAVAMGYGGIVVTNIFAIRMTNPAGLTTVDDPIGPENDWHIKDEAFRCAKIVCAWGTHGRYLNRGREVYEMLKSRWPEKLHHLGLTSGGHPRHPLYVPYLIAPERWS